MSRKLITKDENEFLEKEYKNFESAFKDKEKYLQVMKDFIEKCPDCGACFWRAVQKPCECEYAKAINNL